MTPRTTVSVLIPAYNHERYVLAALQSAANQDNTDADVEIIAVDDRSVDATADILSDFSRHSSVKTIVLRNERNLGICRTLNKALDTAQGDYVGLLASDDAWHPNKLAEQLAALHRHPGVAACFADMNMIGADSEPHDRTFNEWVSASYLPRLHDILAKARSGLLTQLLWHGNFLAAPTALIRRSHLDRAGHFDERLRHEDYDMWLRLSVRAGFVFVDKPLADYRVLASSLSSESGVGFFEDDLRSFDTVRRLSPRWRGPADLAALRTLRRAYRDGYARLDELERVAAKYFGDGYLALAKHSVRRLATSRVSNDDPRISG